MEFILFVGAIFLLVLVLDLRGRVVKLEAIIRGEAPKEARPQERQAEYAARFPQQPLPQGPAPSPAAPPQAPGDDLLDKFVEWLKEDWLMKLGAFLLLIGFGWLTTYAFLNNWIGPMGRITLGIVAGSGILALGWWRIREYLHQGSIFLVLGSTTILLTVFAAREVYGFFTPVSALVIMFLSTAFVAFVSLTYNTKQLAFASLALAAVAPLFTNDPSDDHVYVFAYLLAVILGTLWLVAVKGIRELVLGSLAVVALYSIPHVTGWSADADKLLVFEYVFAALFFLANTLALLKLKGKDAVSDIAAAAGNGLLLLVWILAVADKDWQSLIISAWMVVFAAGAYLVFVVTRRHEPFYAYAGICVAMLAAATAAELDGAALTVAYTIESAVVALLVLNFVRDIRAAERASLLMAVPGILSLGSIFSSAWDSGVVHEDFFVLLILSAALFGLGYVFRAWRSETGEEEGGSEAYPALLVAGSAFAYVLLWLSLHAALYDDDTAVMISLAVYTVIGISAYFSGRAEGKKGLQLYGGVLLGFVMARLLFVDVWRMELGGRVVTFFLLGTMLVSTAFIAKRGKRAAADINNNQ